MKRILKGLVLAAAGLVSFDALAIAPGLYLGLGMGPATNGATNQQVQVLPTPQVGHSPGDCDPLNPTSICNPTTAPGSPKASMFGSRIYMGYKFNQYAGFELGYTYFSGVEYVVRQGRQFISPPSNRPPASSYTATTAAAGTTARVTNLDLVGKIDYTYSDTVGFFGKFGIAYIYTTVPGGLQPTQTHCTSSGKNGSNAVCTTYHAGSGGRLIPNYGKLVTTGSNKYLSKITPTFSFGATYDFNQNWQTEFTVTRLLVGGAVNNITMLSLGLSYHFVDIYCGQFLC
jgi:hypothetical protein